MSSYGYGGRNKDDTTGKIIIITLSGLCILLFIFISIGYFYIAKPLNTSLTSVTLTKLNYNNNTSSSLFFNATLTMELKIENPNFGFFEFPTSRGDILYNGEVVGEMKIKGQRVASFGVIRTEIKTDVSYRENQIWLKNDLKRGVIILETRGKLRGEVHMKALNKRTVNLKCLMHLNLIDQVIQRLWCK